VLQEALDFETESEELLMLLESFSRQDWQRQTQFKHWTANDVIAHLHFFNYAADLALSNSDALARLMSELNAATKQGVPHLVFTRAKLGGLKDRELLKQWRDFYREMAQRFLVADPKKRVPWAGPSMSVRSSITARLMETWAHGQALYDLMGETRRENDRIRSIVVLGINTFAWTFANRQLPVPTSVPYVRLVAPSGAIWQWGNRDPTNCVEGTAVDFCRVVTQVRNVSDTGLKVVGATATAWMAIAQCFAGPPQDPPLPGTRFTQHRR